MDLSLNLIHSSATARSAASAAKDPGDLRFFPESRAPEKLKERRSRPCCHLGYPLGLGIIAIFDQDVPLPIDAFDFRMSRSNEFCRQRRQAGKRCSVVYAKDQLPCFLRSPLTYPSL